MTYKKYFSSFHEEYFCPSCQLPIKVDVYELSMKKKVVLKQKEIK